ncbi:MAG: hypothetical protein UFD57_08595, partial [Collinsella sp.]|nr:hypothetical protein [Collinsella sp.]
VAKVQVFVSFDEVHYTSYFRPFFLIAQIAARADTSPYPAIKTCTFLHNKKAALAAAFSRLGMKKGDFPLWTVTFVNCCEVCLRRES